MRACARECVRGRGTSIYLLVLNWRGEWPRWSDASGLSGERDRLARPWDRLEWSDVSEWISEMSVEGVNSLALA